MKHNYLTQKRIFFLTLLTAFCLQSNAQTDYTVTAIPHQVYVASVPVEFTSDDLYTPAITLPFTFNYFGIDYDQVLISTNGYIDFRTELAGQGSPWSFNTAIPNASFPVKNSILACYHDTNNQVGAGSITYSVTGVAPYRKFVVIFNNQPQFQCNMAAISTFQAVLYETLNTIDVQIVERQVCVTWNGGRAVIGVINNAGTVAAVPPGRNTGTWTAQEEGWRFATSNVSNAYNYTKCDDDTDGLVEFDLQLVEDELGEGTVSFYPTLVDAQSVTNEITTATYTNETASFQTIYATGNGVVTEVVLRVVDCDNDYDSDSVPTANEDVNNDGNLANDDTDGDGIPNFIDNDDDGDMILTSYEYAFNSTESSQQSPQDLMDTDSDGIPNYLDNDDDGDGVLTINEDYNGNNDPSDDDTNFNGLPDYLEQAVALGVATPTLNHLISLYPNPASDTFTVLNKTDVEISTISIFAVNGALVKEIKNAQEVNAVSISDLQSGVYFVKLTTENQVINCKLIKK